MNPIAERVAVCGTPFDVVDLDGTIERIESWIEMFRKDGVPRYITTPNVDFLTNIIRFCSFRTKHPELHSVYRESDLSIADGMPVVLAARLLGAPLPGRVAGSDLVPELVRRTKGLGVYLLGSDEETLARVSDLFIDMNPSIRISGKSSPFIHIKGKNLLRFPEDDEPIIRDINACRPDVLLIGLGNPKQELWFRRIRHRLEVPVSIGIGGTFNFVTGRVKRAPRWMQKTGTEWIYRILAEPRRLWLRYSRGAVIFGHAFVFSILADRMNRLWHRIARFGRADPAPHLEKRGNVGILHASSALRRSNAAGHGDLVFREAHDLDHLVLDLGDTRYSDAAGLGFILALEKWARDAGMPFRLSGVSGRLKGLMVAMRIHAHLEPLISRDVEAAVGLLEDKDAGRKVDCRTEEKNGSLVVDLKGELTDLTAPAIDLDAIQPAQSVENLVLDLEDLNFMDSTGLQRIMRLKDRLAPSNHLVKIKKKGEIKSMLDEAELDSELKTALCR